MVGVAISHTVRIADGSQGTVQEMSEENRGHRDAIAGLTDDLRTAGEHTLTVVTDNNQNHVVSFRQPVEVNGALVWGVDDDMLGAHQGWKIRYVVHQTQTESGVTRKLMRQILNAEGGLERQVEALESVTTSGPGFRMTTRARCGRSSS